MIEISKKWGEKDVLFRWIKEGNECKIEWKEVNMLWKMF